MPSADQHPTQATLQRSDHDDSILNRQKVIRRSVRLTPEGWVFLIILAFVAFGALLRNVNLLIVLAGMMVSAILVNWRSAKLRVAAIAGRRELPTRVYAGKLFSIVWKLQNESPQRIWSLNVQDRVDSSTRLNGEETPSNRMGYFSRLRQKISDKIDQHRRTGPNEVRLNAPQIPPHNQESTVFHCLLNQRGKYHVGPSKISSTFPLGLIEIEVEIDNRQTLYAAPAIGTLTPNWEKRAAAMAAGAESDKRKRGFTEDEFFALRQWRSGDSRRNIHWRTTAKMQKPMVRQFDEPTHRDLAIVIDLFESNAFTKSNVTSSNATSSNVTPPNVTPSNTTQDPPSQASRHTPSPAAEAVLSFASTIAAETKNDLDGQISMAICGQRSDVFRQLNRRRYDANLIRCLATAQTGDDPDLFSAITTIGQSVSSGTPIYVVSTRPQPPWITQIESSPNPGYHQSGDNDLLQSLVHPNRQLGRLKEQIRWIDAGTDDFEALFSLPPSSAQADVDRFEQRRH
jgi:hypothetical protein